MERSDRKLGRTGGKGVNKEDFSELEGWVVLSPKPGTSRRKRRVVMTSPCQEGFEEAVQSGLPPLGSLPAAPLDGSCPPLSLLQWLPNNSTKTLTIQC